MSYLDFKIYLGKKKDHSSFIFPAISSVNNLSLLIFDQFF